MPPGGHQEGVVIKAEITVVDEHFDYGDTISVVKNQPIGRYRTQIRWHMGAVDTVVSPVRVRPGPRHVFQPWEGHHDMSFTLKDNQTVTFAVSGKDAVGNAAPLTGVPVFAVDDASILTLVDNGDGTGSVTSTAVIGVATLSVTDAETNGANFIGSLAFDVIAGDVAAVSIDPGVPTDVAAPSA